MVLPKRLLTALLAVTLIVAAGAPAMLVAHRPASTSPAAVTPLAVALTGRVTDAAHVLTPEQADQLSQRLAKLERDTSHQLVVVIVPSLHGEDIATFTRRHANAWGIGRAGYNDGVVVMLAPTERKIRIEVGRGLEPVLTDARCAAIIKDHILPHFARGDLPGGLAAGVAELDKALR